jgi:hypothetical protein
MLRPKILQTGPVMLSEPNENDKPRWTLPKRQRISYDSLHVSDFILLKRDEDSVLFLRAGNKYPVTFKRGKLMLPAAILHYGENPREAAKRILNEQLENCEYMEPKFLTMQSYMGAHWDICFVFETPIENHKLEPLPRAPFTQVSYHRLTSPPLQEIADDHLEIIGGVVQEKYKEQAVQK